MGSKSSKPSIQENSNVMEKSNQHQARTRTTEHEAPREKQAESSGCPMKRSDGSYSYSLSGMFVDKKHPHGPKGSVPLEMEPKAPTLTDSNDSACSVKHQEYNVYSQPINPMNQMPNLNQLPSPQQSEALDTNRVSSTIPKGGASDGTTWTYPSPQMFYNALARKGKLDNVEEQDMDSVVALHNNMNEKTWKKVCEWEQVLTGDGNVKLLKFMGRPTDLSPKAWFKHNVLGHPLPFDRHDWTVLRGDGKTTVRYVIDYYHDDTRDSEDAIPDLHDSEATASLLVDVRPALDGPWEMYGRGVQMPYARRIANSTPFTPLPMMPTGEMKSQVGESIQVWDNVQKSKRKMSADEIENESVPTISNKEAVALAKSTAQILKDCQEAQAKLYSCSNGQELARASMDLSMCMAKIVCPVQHKAVVQASAKQSDDEIEKALENMTLCVAAANQRTVLAKKQHASVFGE